MRSGLRLSATSLSYPPSPDLDEATPSGTLWMLPSVIAMVGAVAARYDLADVMLTVNIGRIGSPVTPIRLVRAAMGLADLPRTPCGKDLVEMHCVLRMPQRCVFRFASDYAPDLYLMVRDEPTTVTMGLVDDYVRGHLE